MRWAGHVACSGRGEEMSGVFFGGGGHEGEVVL